MISGSAFGVRAKIRRLLPKVHSPSSDLYVSIMFSMSDWPDVSKTKGFFVKICLPTLVFKERKHSLQSF